MLPQNQRPAFRRQLWLVAAVAAVAAVAFPPILLGDLERANGQVLDSNVSRLQKQIQAQKPAKPYEISSGVHLEKNSDKGYLVVQVKLKKGSHIYALTQGGNVPPTKLKLAPSKQLRLTGSFTPDLPAKVIAKDPTFGQRIEKHTGTVRFFAPVQVAPNVDLKKLAVEVQFDGQVCTNDSCVPVRRHKTQSRFAGFFEPSTAKGSARASSVANKPNDAGNWPMKK